MLTVAVPEPPILGVQTPSILARPPYARSSGLEAVQLGESVGLRADDAQRLILDVGLAERANGRWAALEVGELMARQNGKGLPFDLAELHALFILDEPLVIHSAHQFNTAIKAFQRMEQLVTNWDDLRRHVKRVNRSHGEEGIELFGPRREIQYIARTGRGGRGFSANRMFADEAQDLSMEAMQALFPTLSAMPNPQIWYAGTVPKPGERGATFQSARDRGRAAFDAGKPTRNLAWMEWSAARELPDSIEERMAMARDRELWAITNPALGRRITEEFLESEIDMFLEDPNEGLDGVFREIVTIWPDQTSSGVIDAQLWEGRRDPDADMGDPVVFAVDVNPRRGAAAIVAAGWTSDRQIFVELADYRPGTGWVVDRLVELCEDWDTAAVVIDKVSPAATLVKDLITAEVGANIMLTTATELALAAGGFVSEIEEGGRLVHRGQEELTKAVLAGAERPIGDSFAFKRRGGVDISPLVSATLARYGLITTVPEPENVYESRGMTVLG